MATENKNFVETVLEAQQKLVDNVIETTKKATNNNSFVSDSMEKGKEFYKNWLEQQKKAFTGTSEKVENATTNAKENFEKAGTYYQNWLNNQVEMAKKSWEMNQNFFNSNIPSADSFTKMNPFELYNNWNKWYQTYQTANNWNNLMGQFNPSNMFNNFHSQTEQFTSFFNQYQELMKNSFAHLTENLQNAGSKDAFSNMMNITSGFTKFYEMWAPFWKSVQDKTFNAAEFKKNFNFDAYKDLMNNYFGFNTDDTRQYFQQATDMFQNSLKDMAGQGKAAYQHASETIKGFNPFAGQNLFEQVANAYTNMQQVFANAVAPIAKMATPNPLTKNASEWANILDKTAIYNIKNAEMQYMVYQQGQKVMDALVENIMSKMENGVEVNNITALYQEWLNIGDKVFVELFESDEYSQLMAEVSAIQMKLRKEYETQIEKSMSGFPIATKSELDELYKTIYDLKKEVRQLVKMLDLNNNEEPAQNETNETASAKNTNAKKSTPKK
jgi:polyhydroxyalkanoate synthesis regulator phasin